MDLEEGPAFDGVVLMFRYGLWARACVAGGIIELQFCLRLGQIPGRTKAEVYFHFDHLVFGSDFFLVVVSVLD